MIKVKDGYAKLIGTTYQGSATQVLLSNGGDLELSSETKANTLVQRNDSQHIYATYFNSAISDEALTDIGSVYVRNTSDTFIRRISKTQFYSIIDNKFVTLDTAQTITGVKTFSTGPILANNATITQNQKSTSNYTEVVKWLKGGTSQGTYNPSIGQHNTGGDGTGSICILPYPTSTAPWDGTVGLFIGKGVLSLDGKAVAIAENYYTKTESDERYVGGKKKAEHGSQGTAYTADTYSSNFVNKDFVAYAERGSWAYAKNGYITTDTGVNIPLAGTAIFQWGASDTNKTQLFITPMNNYGVSNPAVNEMLFYTSNGSGYISGWSRVLTNRNYTVYTVTKTGGGASGTWGISITGNAATANRIISHSISDTLANKTTPGYLYHAGGSNSVEDKPSGVDAFGVFTMQTASGWYGQLLMSSNASTGLYWRTATSLNGGWKKILDSSNYTDYVNPANFVTSLGTNENYVTWTKNGTTNNLTVPFATTSDVLNNLGKRTAISGTTVGQSGLRLYKVYNNGYPVNYGNVLNIGGAGYGELLFQWTADSNPGHLYYRSKRDRASQAWSDWVTILDNNNYSSTLDGRYVTLDTNQTVSGIKTFSTQQKFTVATGTSPFTVSSTTVVGNLNADLLDGYHESKFPLLNGVKSGTWNWNDVIRAGYYKIQAGTITNHPSGIYSYGMAAVLTTEDHADGENRELQLYYPHSQTNDIAIWGRMHNSSTQGNGWGSWWGIPNTEGVKKIINTYYWANIPLQSTPDSTKIPVFGGMTVNGHTIINKRLTIGQDLGVWNNSRAELELISPSGQANDFWLGSGQRDWLITSRSAAENNTLNFYAYLPSSNTTPLVMTLEKSGNMYLQGNLYVGNNTTRNFIAFRGTTGDDQTLYRNTFIGENHFGSTESSELILFKGNDVGTHATSLSTSGPDRIRYVAAAHLFQTYSKDLQGTFSDICTSTVPVNMLAIHQTSIQTYAPLVIIGDRYEGNYGINMSNSNIVGLNAIFTQDLAEGATEGYQFKRTNGNYDSIWCADGTFYFSPNGNNASQNGSYSTNYTVLHTGNYTGILDSRYVLARGTYGSGSSYDSDWGQSVVTFDPVVSGTYPENNPNITILNLGGNYARRKQLACMYNNNNIYYRRRTDSSWSEWVRLAIVGESYTKGDSDGRYYPISGNVNMSGDNKWIGSTMGGGTDYWRIGGSGTSDNGVCQITIGDNSNDYFQIVIADYSGTNYTALQVKAGGTYAPHFYESSDQRLKTNIQAILNKDNIPQIKEFDWKEDGSHSYGLIAQELEEMGYSELVDIKEDGYKTVNYSAALSLIVGKLQVKIRELEKEIENLKNKN